MPANTSNIKTTWFSKGVTVKAAKSHVLNGKYRMKSNVVGGTAKFPYFGNVAVVPKAFRAETAVTSPDEEFRECNMTAWLCSEYTDVMQSDTTNIDEVRELINIFGSAIGRQQDQFVLDALAGGVAGDFSDYAATIEVGSSANTQFSTAKFDATSPYGILTTADEVLDDNEVEAEDRLAIFPAKWKKYFMRDDALINADYKGNHMAVKNGRLTMTSGMEILFIGQRNKTARSTTNAGQGGWNSTGGVGYIYQKNALGVAYTRKPQLYRTWRAEMTSHFLGIGFQAGSCVIAPERIVRVTNGPIA